MSYVAIKYNIDEETVKQLIKDGVVSWTYDYHYDIYRFYCDLIDNYSGQKKAKTYAMIDTCLHFNLSRTHFYRIRSIFI